MWLKSPEAVSGLVAKVDPRSDSRVRVPGHVGMRGERDATHNVRVVARGPHKALRNHRVVTEGLELEVVEWSVGAMVPRESACG